VHGAALALRSLCDGHHKKAFLIAELPRKTPAFLIAPVLSGISSDLIKSQWTMGVLIFALVGLIAIAAAIWLIRLPMR
jgi:hypothetical protein